MAEQICERIAEGEPLTRICKDRQIPAYRTVLGWRVANKEFQHMYARAREDAADTLADQIRELAERVEMPARKAVGHCHNCLVLGG
jgi:hypothetical protein